MSSVANLSRERSPFLDRGGIRTILGLDEEIRVHADAVSLRAIRDCLMDAASREHGKLFGHIRDHDLREVEHYLAIYVHGYEFNESGRPDDEGDSWEWRTGVGSYGDAHSALRPWIRSLDEATFMVRRLCPWLRLDLGLNGKGLSRLGARFSKRHPVAGLAGAEVALPVEWPRSARRTPAIAVAYAFLEALAMEKERGYPYPAVSR